MLVLFPHRSPDGHVIKAAVRNPGNRLVRFVRGERFTHRLDRLLDFRWLTYEPWGLTAKEAMIQDPSSSGGNSQHVERSIPRDQSFPIQGWNGALRYGSSLAYGLRKSEQSATTQRSSSLACPRYSAASVRNWAVKCSASMLERFVLSPLASRRTRSRAFLPLR
jgi:hypothetical protein